MAINRMQANCIPIVGLQFQNLPKSQVVLEYTKALFVKIVCTCLKKTGLKITQFEKVHLIKVNELKLTQVELFSFFPLCVLLLMHPNYFVWSILQILNAFYTIPAFHFKHQILYA